MKHCMLLLMLLALGCVHGAPVAQNGMEDGSCEDGSAKGAAELALSKINLDRTEGYIFALHRLSNVHMAQHGENGMVFYLTLDVVETNCSVLSQKDWKACEARPTSNMPVYGQCKAAIYISKVHRVVRLYKYNCVVRPVPSARVHRICPDCPSLIGIDDAKAQEAVSLSLAKFNREGGLTKRFALLKVNRASAGMAMSMYYNVEYTIQETTCLSSAGAADPCPFLECEFTHKGFCKGSLWKSPSGVADTSVDCEIYEPEAAEREKKLHLLANAADHQHNDTHAHSQTHDGAHAADQAHDHAHDHTKSHAQHDQTQKHAANSDHHHTHDHAAGSAHDHSHDHGHNHDHVHTHHAKAHDHTGDFPHQHHNYHHAPGVHTHEHDHELALDHDHKHAHLHEHEHHHHHHDHVHETTPQDHPEGMVKVLPAMDQAVTLPALLDATAGGAEVGVTLPLKEDPQIPGQMEPTILPYPIGVSANCSPAAAGETLVENLFSEDPLFKPAARSVKGA